jgi:hypothetical protein
VSTAVIGKVCKRGSDVRRLLGYLFREGLAGEHGLTASHSAPRLIAAWDGTDGLEPRRTAGDGRDLRHLAGALNAPLLAAGLDRKDWPGARPVYHLAIAAADDDKHLTDEQWADIAAEYVDQIGLAPRRDDEAVRWVAVRHAENHIHVVATLARQDGRRVWPRNDFYRSREASLTVEARYGLRTTSPADRTGARETSRAEHRRHAAGQEHRREAGRPATSGPDREVLRRRVRAAAGAASGLPEFVERLRADGVLVRERYSQQTAGEVTGYAVALRSGDGSPVWFGGGKLAPDLTLPKLRARWDAGGRKVDPRLHRPGREQHGPQLTPFERVRALKYAELAARNAAEHIAHIAHSDPAGAADAAWAAADLLSVTARLVEGPRVGSLSQAADQFERAAREVHRRTPAVTDAGHGLRNASGMLSALQLLRTGENRQLLALMTQLVRLADSVAELRETQHRAAQAAAARAAAEQMRAVMPRPAPEPRPGPASALQARSVAVTGPAAITRPTPGRSTRG